MKNFLILFGLLCGIGFLVYWLWTASPVEKEPTLREIIADQPLEEKTPKNTEKDKKIKLDAVEIEIDDRDKSLILRKLYNTDINKKITENEVKAVELYNGILTFSEKIDGHWHFKAVNLEQYIEKYLKK